MGFDNECILNIQTLAGEYFCPVCRLLVLPNEALQSQCTHLYCKPCLTYIVSTTKACPYDGYLVTEADAKPLTESNKALAETISKIIVHCLYHRSGCTWQGALSDCLVHCSGCAFGNSPVVCNRCSIQIVHRQVQEHAQNCPGVPQGQQVGSGQVATATTTTTTTTTGDQTASQTGIATSQAQTSQSNAITAAGQVANVNSQAQVTAPVAAVSSDQWYQQQYQQYYQQYTNYEAYYQQYYPYQQQAVPQVPHQNQQGHGSAVTGQQQVYVQSQQQPQPQDVAQVQSQPQSHLQAQLQQQSLGQPQLYSSAQTNVAAQSQNVAHINQQQQPNSYIAPSQISSQCQTQPPAQVHFSQAQVLPQAQLQPQFQPVQLPVQQAQAQILQQPQTQLHSQPVIQPHVQPQTQPHIHASQPSQPLNTSLPSQHPSAHAVTGNQSYPQPQPQLRPQMQLGGVQHPLPMHPQSGFHSQLPHQVQVQSPHPQMQPLQSHAPTSNQQNPPFLPSPSVHPSVHRSGLPVQQLVMLQQAQATTQQPYVQQPLSGQPVASLQNQMSQRMPLIQQHLALQSHLRPLGATHSLQQHSQAYLQPTQNNASAHVVRPHPLQHNMVRPSMPNHGMPSHPLTLTSVEVRPKQIPANRPPAQPMPEAPGDKVSDKHVAKVEGDAFVISNDNSEVGAKSEAYTKAVDEKAIGEVGDGGGGDNSLKDISESSKTVKTEPELNAVGVSLNGKSAEEKIMRERTDVSQFNNRKDKNSVSEGKESNGGSLMRMPLLHEEEKNEERGRKSQHDQVQPHGQVIPKDRGLTDFKESQYHHERQKHVPSHYVSNAVQQRPPGPGIFQGPPSGLHVHTQPPGLPPSQFRPQGPGHSALPENLPPGPFGMGPGSYPPQGPHLGAPRMSQGDSVGRPTLGMPRFTSLDSHGAPPYGSDSGMNSNTLTRLNGGPGFDSASSDGFRNNRINPVHDEQMDQFHLNSGRHISAQGQVDGDVPRFARPPRLDAEPVSKLGSYYSSSSLDKGPLGPNFDPSVDSGFSRNFPPYHSVGRMPPNDAGERLVGLHDDPIGRRDFAGPVPGFGRRYMDNFQSGSPGGEYPGLSPRFRGHNGDDIDHREHRFGRFPGLHRAEFDGPDNFHMAEFMGRDLPPSHLRRGDFMDPRSLPPNLRYREAGGFGPFSSHERMGEFARPGDIPHPRLGEPGFRSSFQGFANESRVFGGEIHSFENMRKRKPTSMGWCRICKVDCETVEGLELHSQTREHQKMAMDMVAFIKQNSKKQKLNTSDRSANDAKKLRNTSFEGRGNKH